MEITVEPLNSLNAPQQKHNFELSQITLRFNLSPSFNLSPLPMVLPDPHWRQLILLLVIVGLKWRFWRDEKQWNGWAQIELVEIESRKPSLLALQFSDLMVRERVLTVVEGSKRTGGIKLSVAFQIWPLMKWMTEAKIIGSGFVNDWIRSCLWVLSCSSQWICYLISLYVYF